VNEQELGRKVAQMLEAGLDDIPAPQRYRLERARAAALAHAQDRDSHSLPLTPAVAAGFGWRRLLAPGLALVLLLAGMLYWEQLQRLQYNYADNAELDSALLTEELPMAAYLDQGFEIWLYHETPAAGEP
jgi:hypothetical protein